MGPITDSVAKSIRHNIETIARMEETFHRERKLPDRVADCIGDFSGTVTFVVVHAVFFAGWIVANLGLIPHLKPWDHFPFLLLGLVVSLEAIFLSAFVLMKQSRMSRRADERAHLDLQINLLAERETTLMLQMLHSICQRLKVDEPGEEVLELAEETPVEAMATELQRAMSTEGQPASTHS